MEQHISVITVGVDDLEKMTRWYKEKFGWVPFKNSGGTVFFRLDKLLLMLEHKDQLARDVSTWQDGVGFKRFTFTIGFSSEEEVNRMFHELEKNSVMIIRHPEKLPGGVYRGYIADPEDNFWELAYYPFMEMRNLKTFKPIKNQII